MRGRQTSIARAEADLVLVAARYEGSESKLLFVRGYERRGVVWSDIVLYDRARLLHKLERGTVIVTGRPAELEGDFEILAPVHLGAHGEIRAGNESRLAGDDLQLPIL